MTMQQHHATTSNLNSSDARLPPYLARHIKLGFNSDDIAALIDSIDSSQLSQPSTIAQLPAELLLEILEYVPVDYILDWRLVCRGFRDAIDGRVLYHHLRRTELIGYLGSREARTMRALTDEQYDDLHLMRAQFSHVEQDSSSDEKSSSVWNSKYAIFQVDRTWCQKWKAVNDIPGSAENSREARILWFNTLQKLEHIGGTQGFGALRWCMRLDHAVLDLAFPRDDDDDDDEKTQFTFGTSTSEGKLRISWRNLLFDFLKTETGLRRLMEKKQSSPFTYTLTEDCLRSTRRKRLLASLDDANKVHRHIKWSLRLLPPLFGIPSANHTAPLEPVENEATSVLLLLRREAALSPLQIAYLHQLALDYESMQEEVEELESAFREFKGHLKMPEVVWSAPVLQRKMVSRNPVAWGEDVLGEVKGLVGKWKAQRHVLSQMMMLLTSSNLALALPEDSFEELDSEF
ncbi:hypothetical protein NX059_010829 [Plenodomus lindquistii]|nr:hypothetical protein NX059_010829 [Plenodomus lindquistii]